MQVDWYPWGEEAFKKARELDRPIFLSVGYSTCHWQAALFLSCHRAVLPLCLLVFEYLAHLCLSCL
jgi:hypothetical protein